MLLWGVGRPERKGALTRVFDGQVSFVTPPAEKAVCLAAGSCAFIGVRDDDTGTVAICRGDLALARRLPGAPLYSKQWSTGSLGDPPPQDGRQWPGA